jgi:hypothetical protein
MFLKNKRPTPPVNPRPFALAALLGLPLSACGPGDAADAITADPGIPDFMTAEIETGNDGRCYGRDITPAVIETVTAYEVETPAVIGPDGSVLTPASYRTVTRQEIIRERGEVTFETLCPPAYTVEFVATLQRALTTRGLFTGPINGLMDTATGRAVQDFQRFDGPDSPLLSIEAARRLGIVELSAEQINNL